MEWAEKNTPANECVTLPAAFDEKRHTDDDMHINARTHQYLLYVHKEVGRLVVNNNHNNEEKNHTSACVDDDE